MRNPPGSGTQFLQEDDVVACPSLVGAGARWSAQV
jgi:hypothetical protein